MKTPMQELIEQLKELKAYIAVTHGLERSLPYQTAIDYAETMLEQEKDTMKSCIVMGMEFIPVDPNNYNEDAEEVYNETFNTKPKTNELTQLRKLAGLLQSVWNNGNWKAETYNEREMEKIMTEQGYWPTLPNPNQIGKMTPKQKAEDLWLSYYELIDDSYSSPAAKEMARGYARIAVDEILNNFGLESMGKKHYTNAGVIEFYEQVKQEIENL